MIKTKTLLKTITQQKTNRFVSVHLPWGTFHKPVKKVVKKLSNGELISLVDKIAKSDHDFLLSVAEKHKSVNAFLKDRLINPTPDFISEDIRKWAHANSPVVFTIECLPVKSQNPLKTTNTLPDLAEIACLTHFNEVGRVLKEKFNLLVKFKFLVEANIYGELFGIPRSTSGKFFALLKRLQNEIIKGEFIELVNWESELLSLNNFEGKLEEQKLKIKGLFQDGDEEVVREFLTIFPTVFMSIKPEGNPEDIIIKCKKISRDVLRHVEKAKEVTINIMAFNRTRKLLNERTILFQNNLRATLTPAKGKWAFYPIGPWNKMYPHHGVGVFNTKNNTVTVLYERDIEQNLSNDGDLLFFNNPYLIPQA
jgi:hypothetical protein